jgi:hypothetical protein
MRIRHAGNLSGFRIVFHIYSGQLLGVHGLNEGNTLDTRAKAPAVKMSG